MSREWVPRGGTKWCPFVISEDTKQQLILILKANGIEIEDTDPFFEDLNDALTSYKGWQEIRRSCKPATVRANLDKAINDAKSLNDSLRKLDGVSRQLLKEAYPDGGWRGLHFLATRISVILFEARYLAEDLPQKGSLKDYGKLILAYKVGVAILNHLGRRPTQTKDGLYDSALSIIVGVATGKEAPNVYGLVSHILKKTK